MSHEVESMFYNSFRGVPWHGLGVSVEGTQTSKEAIELAGLNWEVNKMPIYDSTGNVIAGYFANTRDSDNSVLGIVSGRYSVVQNKEAFAFTDSLVGEGMRYETAGSLRDGKQIWLLGELPSTKVLGEDFSNYICFSNTFDGSGAIRVFLCPTRVVCQNTLNLALSNAQRSWSTRHIGDLAGKLHQAKETLGLAQEYMKKLDEDADRLANTKLSDAEIESIVSFIFPIDYIKDTKRKIENTNKMRNDFMTCYMMPDIAQYRNTAYGLVNAASDMAGHMAPSRVTSNYAQNNWAKIMLGHPLLDAVYNRVTE
jgi:phage/plasmid-like protein (TIGR03299 family)